MKVRLKVKLAVGGGVFKGLGGAFAAGDVVDLPDDMAEQLIAKGMAEPGTIIIASPGVDLSTPEKE